MAGAAPLELLFSHLALISLASSLLHPTRLIKPLVIVFTNAFTAISNSDIVMMVHGVILIIDFQGKIAKDIWETNTSKSLPRELWMRAKALLTIMHATRDLDDLKIKGQPPNIRLHKLKGDRKEYWSVTIKLPWCVTFKFKNGEFTEVKIENYH